MDALQGTRGIAPTHGDENMDTYYCEQYKRFRQIKRRRVEPVSVPIVYLDLPRPVYRRAKHCRCTGCKRKTLNEVAEDESKAAEEAERAGEELKPKKILSLKAFNNVVMPSSFLQEVVTGIIFVLTSNLQHC